MTLLADDTLLTALIAAGVEAGTAPNRLLMQLAMVAPDRAALETALADGHYPPGHVIEAVRTLWHETPEAWATVHMVLGVLYEVEQAGLRGAPRWTAVFDRLADLSPEAAVALYSLGRADLLNIATDEVSRWMIDTGLVPVDGAVLDLGCGAGRFCTVLAPFVRQVIGLDVSHGMLAEAGRRCADHANIAFVRGSGLDLACLADGSFDLVYAIDSFPYLVDLGDAVVVAHLSDVFRLLRPGGRLLILNYSYRGDDETDRLYFARFAAAAGFHLLVNGGSGPEQWPDCVFLLAKPHQAEE